MINLDTIWLMLPYTLLLVVTGVQFFLVEQLGKDMLSLLKGKKLAEAEQYLELAAGWYWWLAREAKDWSLFAIVAVTVFFYGLRPDSDIIMWFIGLLSGALTVKVILSMILLVHLSSITLPKVMVRAATNASMPDISIAGARRRVCWGLVFLLSGFSSLAGWVDTGGLPSLLLGFLFCFMGFYSVFSTVPAKFSPVRKLSPAQTKEALPHGQ